VTIFADALVALYRFSPLDDVLPLFQTCLEAERSDAVKLVAIKASVTLSVEVRNICSSEASGPVKELLGARDIMATHNSASFRASGGKIPNHLQGNHMLHVSSTRELHVSSMVVSDVMKLTRTASSDELRCDPKPNVTLPRPFRTANWSLLPSLGFGDQISVGASRA
jgi:hypothetical protein